MKYRIALVKKMILDTWTQSMFYLHRRKYGCSCFTKYQLRGHLFRISSHEEAVARREADQAARRQKDLNRARRQIRG